MAKIDELFRALDTHLEQKGFDPTTNIVPDTDGNLVLDTIGEDAVEVAMHEVAKNLDTAEILKLETITDLFLALYMAVPSVGRKYLANLFARKVKKALGGKSPAHDTVAGLLLEALDQGNVTVMTTLDKAGLQPEDMRAALLDKFSVNPQEIKDWLAGKANEIRHKVEEITGGHGGDHNAHAAVVTTPVKLDPYLVIATDWNPEVAKLFYVLEAGAEEENNGNPKKRDGTAKKDEERPWLGQADGFMRGLNRNLASPDGLARLEKIFVRLHANHVTAAQLEQDPFSHAKVAIKAIVGRKDPFSAANLFDHADKALSLSKWGRRIAGTEVVVIKDTAGTVLKERPSHWRHIKWPVVLLAAIVLSVPVIGIVGFGWSAMEILSVAADQTGPVAADITTKLKTPMKWQTIGLVLILFTRLFTTPLLDLPFQGGGWLAHKLKVKESDTPTTPAFDLGTLITSVSGGLCMLMLGIGGLTIWGGGSAHSSMLACLIIADLVFWGEMLKRFKSSKWPDERHGDHPLTGDERKLNDTWWRYMIGLALSTAALLVFIVAIPIDGYITAHSREISKAATDQQATACTAANATLSALAAQWNKRHDSTDSGDALLCLAAADMAADSASAARTNNLCQQVKLCPVVTPTVKAE